MSIHRQETGSLIIRRLSSSDHTGLAGYYFWKDMQCLEQAVLVAADNEVDVDEIERWSSHEGMFEEFRKIKGKLVR